MNEKTTGNQTMAARAAATATLTPARRRISALGHYPFAITQTNCVTCNASFLRRMEDFYARIDRRGGFSESEEAAKKNRTRRSAGRR